jgi:hypothetical protein
MKRLQSEVEVGAALSALIDSVDLIDTGIRVSLKFPHSTTDEQQGETATELTAIHVFPMQIRRRGFEMRLVIPGSRAPAPLVDLALMKPIARGCQWSDDLLAGRVESVAAIAKREGVLPKRDWLSQWQPCRLVGLDRSGCATNARRRNDATVRQRLPDMARSGGA